MKKAIGLTILWVIGSILIGLPALVTVIGALGIFGSCYLGVYHRSVGIGIYTVFIWGLGVAVFSIPNYGELSDLGLDGVVEIVEERDFAALVEGQPVEASALSKRLAELDTALNEGLISASEQAELRQKVLTEFSQQ